MTNEEAWFNYLAQEAQRKLDEAFIRLSRPHKPRGRVVGLDSVYETSEATGEITIAPELSRK